MIGCGLKNIITETIINKYDVIIRQGREDTRPFVNSNIICRNILQ